MEIPSGARIIRAFVHPDADENRLEAHPGGKYVAWVRARAENNHANRELLLLLAREFTVSITQLRIISGHQKSLKTVLMREGEKGRGE